MDDLIAIEEALIRIFAHSVYEKTEACDLINGLGKTLAENIYAKYDAPAFDRAMLDGYAVRYDDIKLATRDNPVRLRISAHVPAGTVPTMDLETGEAFRTMTGAPLANGADTLIQQEFTEIVTTDTDSVVSVLRSVTKGEAIQLRGQDVKAGDLLLAKGRQIGPVEMAMLASQGVTTVTTMTPPQVGIFATGSEIIDPHQQWAPGHVFNSNTPMLSALIQQAGANPCPHLAIIDDFSQLREKLHDSLLHDDMIVTTGGVSVGDFDVTPKALESLGVQRLFWGVYMRPGTPVYVGLFKGKLVFALSGNPPAAFVNAKVLLLPAIRKMLQVQDQGVHQMSARLYQAPNKRKVKHTRFLTGRLFTHQGEWWIDVGGDQSAGSMSRFLSANALVRVEPGDELQDGELVTAELW